MIPKLPSTSVVVPDIGVGAIARCHHACSSHAIGRQQSSYFNIARIIVIYDAAEKQIAGLEIVAVGESSRAAREAGQEKRDCQP